MRIYNRDQSAILGARNNRLAKMRAFSSSTKTRASSKGTTQSAPKSKNYRTSAWMQFLNQFQNGTAVSGNKIVENQKKSYDYEITGLAAERVETHMKRFLEEGEKSLYQEGEDTGKQLQRRWPGVWFSGGYGAVFLYAAPEPQQGRIQSVLLLLSEKVA